MSSGPARSQPRPAALSRSSGPCSRAATRSHPLDARLNAA
jgi:hypothetical protein